MQHFKVDPVLKINETFYKQAESMWTKYVIQNISGVENFRIVDIEINVWSPFFVNLKIF